MNPPLPSPQRDQILAAIEAAEFDRGEFDLTDDGLSGRLVHRASGSCFAFHRDSAWRFLGHCCVADGPQLEFDRSWTTLMQLMAVWLSELRRHLGARPRHGLTESR
jgi:hypothetical protein